MDFARQQLEKAGWKEGMGLGRNSDGMSTAIKPKLKFNTNGFGYSQSRDDLMNNWWDKAFQSAAQRIAVSAEVADNGGSGSDDDSSRLEEATANETDVVDSSKAKKKKKNKTRDVEKSVANGTETEPLSEDISCPPKRRKKSKAVVSGGDDLHKGGDETVDEPPAEKPSSTKLSSYSNFKKTGSLLGDVFKPSGGQSSSEHAECVSVKPPSDTDLYNICQGRTAHKGARHGFKMSAKTTRAEMQELLWEQTHKRVGSSKITKL